MFYRDNFAQKYNCNCNAVEKCKITERISFTCTCTPYVLETIFGLFFLPIMNTEHMMKSVFVLVKPISPDAIIA